MRDLRDPEKLGELILKRTTRPLSKAYDRGKTNVPDVSHDNSMQKEAQEAYKPTMEILQQHGGVLDEA